MQLYTHLLTVWEMKYLSPPPHSLPPVTEKKLQKPSYINKGNIPIKLDVMTGNPPTIAPNAWNNKALIIVTQSAEFNGKVSIVPMKQAGAGTLDISKALIYDGFGKILDVTTTGY